MTTDCKLKEERQAITGVYLMEVWNTQKVSQVFTHIAYCFRFSTAMALQLQKSPPVWRQSSLSPTIVTSV